VHGRDPPGDRVGQQDGDAVGGPGQEGRAGPGGDEGVARRRAPRVLDGLDGLDVGTVHLVHQHRCCPGLPRDLRERVGADRIVRGVAEAQGDVGEGDLDHEVAFDPITVVEQRHGPGSAHFKKSGTSRSSSSNCT
jgi:hypothetical protein